MSFPVPVLFLFLSPARCDRRLLAQRVRCFRHSGVRSKLRLLQQKLCDSNRAVLGGVRIMIGQDTISSYETLISPSKLSNNPSPIVKSISRNPIQSNFLAADPSFPRTCLPGSVGCIVPERSSSLGYDYGEKDYCRSRIMLHTSGLRAIGRVGNVPRHWLEITCQLMRVSYRV